MLRKTRTWVFVIIIVLLIILLILGDNPKEVVKVQIPKRMRTPEKVGVLFLCGLLGVLGMGGFNLLGEIITSFRLREKSGYWVKIRNPSILIQMEEQRPKWKQILRRMFPFLRGGQSELEDLTTTLLLVPTSIVGFLLCVVAIFSSIVVSIMIIFEDGWLTIARRITELIY